MIKECSVRRLQKPNHLSRRDTTLSDYIVGKVGIRLSQNQKKKQRRAETKLSKLCETNLSLNSIKLESPDNAVEQISDADSSKCHIDAQDGGKEEIEIKEIDVDKVSPIMTDGYILSDGEVDQTDGQVARGEGIRLQSFGRFSVEVNEEKLDEEDTSVSTVEHVHGFKQLRCDHQSSDTNVSIISPTNIARTELYTLLKTTNIHKNTYGTAKFVNYICVQTKQLSSTQDKLRVFSPSSARTRQS